VGFECIPAVGKRKKGTAIQKEKRKETQKGSVAATASHMLESRDGYQSAL
jgi:hypothetical protein